MNETELTHITNEQLIDELCQRMNTFIYAGIFHDQEGKLLSFELQGDSQEMLGTALWLYEKARLKVLNE